MIVMVLVVVISHLVGRGVKAPRANMYRENRYRKLYARSDVRQCCVGKGGRKFRVGNGDRKCSKQCVQQCGRNCNG